MQDRSKNKNTVKVGEEGTIYDLYDSSLVIRLQNELDHHNAIRIRENADRLISRYHFIKYIIFDFSNANFMDSAGIGVIMGRYKKVIFVGGKVAVVNVGSAVDRIFKLSGLYKIIDKFETVEGALKGLQKEF